MSSTTVTIAPRSSRLFPLSYRARSQLFTAVLLLGDALAVAMAFWLAYFVRFEVLPYHSTYQLRDYALLVASTIPMFLIILAVFQLYSAQYLFGGTQEYATVFNGISVGTLALAIVGFFQRDTLLISRGWLGFFWFFAVVFVSGARFAFRQMIYALRHRGHLLSPAVIVGANDEGRALAQQLKGWAGSGLYLLGFVDADGAADTPVTGDYRLLGDLAALERLVTEHGVQEIIVAPTAINRTQLLEVFRTFSSGNARYLDVNLRLSSGLFEIMTTGLQVKELAGVPLITVNKARVTGPDAVLKSLLDYSLTIPGLIFLAPLLALIALVVKLDSPGPVFYRRRVMGVGGKVFGALKFRTMQINGDEILAAHPELKAELTNNHKLKDDPRITRVGKFLRKYSLDELPQLFNVLWGQMSLVGPRMISPPEMDEYGKWGMNLLTVRPGITGLWQVSGRSDVSYEERVRLDMHYIRNWSIWLDLQLLARTVPVVLRGKGAY